MSRIPKLAAAKALEKLKTHTKSVTKEAGLVAPEISTKADNKSPDKREKSPKVTLLAKPIDKSATRNEQIAPVSKLSTIKKSASLASHKVSIQTTATGSTNGRASVRNTLTSSTSSDINSTVVKSKVFEVKRNSIYEKLPSS